MGYVSSLEGITFEKHTNYVSCCGFLSPLNNKIVMKLDFLQGLGRFGVKTDKMFQTVIGIGRLGGCMITLLWQYLLGSIVKI